MNPSTEVFALSAACPASLLDRTISCIYLPFFWTPERASSRSRQRICTWTTSLKHLMLLVTCSCLNACLVLHLRCRWAQAITHLVSYFHNLPGMGLDILKAEELQHYSSINSVALGRLCSWKTVVKGHSTVAKKHNLARQPIYLVLGCKAANSLAEL